MEQVGHIDQTLSGFLSGIFVEIFADFASTSHGWICDFPEAIEFFVDGRFPLPNHKMHLGSIPHGSLEECWLSLKHFDYSPGGKNGCGGLSKQFF